MKFQDKCYSHRTTIHTTLNNKVLSHAYGNWNNCGYVIIEPFIGQDKSPMGFGKEDTYFSRDVNLTDKGMLLVSEEKYNQLTDEQKKEYNISIFKGDSSIATTKALIMMGYKPQDIQGIMSSKNAYDQNEQLFFNYHKEKNFNSSNHFHTIYHELENNSIIRDEFLFEQRKEFIDTKEKNLLMTPEEVYKYYEERVLLSDKEYKQSFSEFLVANGILMDHNDNYFALTSANAIKVSKSYHKSEASNDFDKDKLEIDFKGKYEKLLATVKKNEENKIMAEIMTKMPGSFTEKERAYAINMIKNILK